MTDVLSQDTKTELIQPKVFQKSHFLRSLKYEWVA